VGHRSALGAPPTPALADSLGSVPSSIARTTPPHCLHVYERSADGSFL